MIALSTAFKRALIGINIEGNENCKDLDACNSHSEKIMQTLDKMLDDLNLSIKDNKSYAVVVGPGSFTGIRIGIALIKGLMAGSDIENVISITTFELMAKAYIDKFKPEQNFACVIDALSGFYFICMFDKNGNKLNEEKMINREELETILAPKVSLWEENIENSEKIELTSDILLALAIEKEKKEEYISPKKLTPLYLRKSQAEVALEERMKTQKKF